MRAAIYGRIMERVRLGPGQVLITGDVVTERVFDTAELDARAHVRREVPYVTRRCRQTHQVCGVPLHEVLTETPTRLDPRHKMAHLNIVVLATSEDGYQVALSLAEIEPEFGACGALLATRYNGEVLPRPMLVMPADARASRYVRRLCRLCLVSLAPWDLARRSL